MARTKDAYDGFNESLAELDMLDEREAALLEMLATSRPTKRVPSEPGRRDFWERQRSAFVAITEQIKRLSETRERHRQHIERFHRDGNQEHDFGGFALTINGHESGDVPDLAGETVRRFQEAGDDDTED